MIRFLVAAPASGCGKTVVTCALLGALKAMGLDPCAFKCGPDYIDPMFHRAALGVESHNLDLFLSDEAAVRRLFARYSAGHGAAVAEGVMGYYDGVGGTTARASAWHLADTLGLPALLAVNPRGSSLTLAAAVRGLRDFKPQSRLAGLILNPCAPMLYKTLAPMLERETGLPVLGYLPPMDEAQFESRHLGLLTAAEVQNLRPRLDALAETARRTIDWPRLLAVCGTADEDTAQNAVHTQAGADASDRQPPRAKIAVARDEAFCFAYAETLDALRDAGAELCFFSPLRDTALPAGAGGLYLPGGYPELHARALAQNAPLRAAVRRAVQSGLPTVAECGGFLYLGQTLQDEAGTPWPMAGALPGDGVKTPRLVRFGYAELRAETPSLLLRPGEALPVHEFHYWDSTQTGAAFTAQKPLTGRSWPCGFAGPALYAAFPHLYLAGRPELARRWVQAAQRYAAAREI